MIFLRLRAEHLPMNFAVISKNVKKWQPRFLIETHKKRNVEHLSRRAEIVQHRPSMRSDDSQITSGYVAPLASESSWECPTPWTNTSDISLRPWGSRAFRGDGEGWRLSGFIELFAILSLSCGVTIENRETSQNIYSYSVGRHAGRRYMCPQF